MALEVYPFLTTANWPNAFNYVTVFMTWGIFITQNKKVSDGSYLPLPTLHIFHYNYQWHLISAWKFLSTKPFAWQRYSCTISFAAVWFQNLTRCAKTIDIQDTSIDTFLNESCDKTGKHVQTRWGIHHIVALITSLLMSHTLWGDILPLSKMMDCILLQKLNNFKWLFYL